MVDWVRIPYRTRFRPWRDSANESTIRWIEARPDAPVLPFESIIVNSFNEADKELWDGVGEVWGARRPYTGQRAPAGVEGGHYCGTPRDFAEGGTYDPSVPPARYGALGYPLCCDPPKRVVGGGGAGGRAVPAVLPPRAVYGGGGAGGTAHPSVIAARTPGANCLAAVAADLGTLYTWDQPSAQGWVRFDAPAPGTTLHVEYDLPLDASSLTVYTGPDCAHLVHLFAVEEAGCFTYTFGWDTFIWFNLFATAPPMMAAASLLVGACP